MLSIEGTTPLLTLIVAFTDLEPTDVEPLNVSVVQRQLALNVSKVNVAIPLVELGKSFSHAVGIV